MAYSYFCGWDVSKKSLNLCLMDASGEVLLEEKVDNSVGKLRQAIERLYRGKLRGVSSARVLHCLENTGHYSHPLLKLVPPLQLQLWLEDPLQLSHSLGRQRTKTDRIDARNIARYAALHRREVKLYQPPNPVVEQLRMVRNHHQKLVRYRQSLRTSFNEVTAFSLVDYDEGVARIIGQQIEHLDRAIAQLEQRIEGLILQDEHTKRCYDIARSVPGLGPKNTITVLVVTGLFERIGSAKACASYAGISPHAFESGSSIRRRPRISRASSRLLKTAFSQGAMSMIRGDNAFNAMYRRLVAKGRTHLQALNAVRNKIIRVVYACIANDTMYEKNKHKYLQMS